MTGAEWSLSVLLGVTLAIAIVALKRTLELRRDLLALELRCLNAGAIRPEVELEACPRWRAPEPRRDGYGDAFTGGGYQPRASGKGPGVPPNQGSSRMPGDRHRSRLGCDN